MSSGKKFFSYLYSVMHDREIYRIGIPSIFGIANRDLLAHNLFVRILGNPKRTKSAMPVLALHQNPDVFSKFGRKTSGIPRLPDARWYVACVKSRQDKEFARALAANKISYFLAMQQKPMSSGGRVVQGMELLFPGFVFFLGFPDDTYRAWETKRMFTLWKTDDQFQLRRDLERIARAVKCVELTRLEQIQPGRSVRIITGHPLEGMEAKVDLRKNTTVYLDIHPLGCVTFTVEAQYLEVLK
jgi:hypothetical protein